MRIRSKKSSGAASKLVAMAKRSSKATIFFIFVSFMLFCAFLPVFAPLPSFHSHSPHRSHRNTVNRKFEIASDRFWRDGEPFQIIGGDVHYFRVHPEYWEDRLLKAKALGLNTIQTYVPWNLHEPAPGKFVFEGFANIEAFLNLCHKLDLLVMIRPGPYICAEWDWGGFPGWFYSINPTPKPRSSDPTYLQLVERWWGNLLPKLVPLLYDNGGPIIMVQIENEFGSYGDDKAYLHHLVTLARDRLGHDVILYTTDGGVRENLEKGSIRGDAVFSAVDFSTGDDPWPIFKLQKEFNAPGKSPPLSAEFYTGWLTHWGEKIAMTDADSTAAALEKILRKNGSAVLYMAHGGTNFGFYSGANTGVDEADYKPDLTSYDYDAPIRESGDVDNSKFNAIRRVIARYSSVPLPSVPSNNEKARYGPIHLQRKAFLFDTFDFTNSTNVFESETPMPMEYVGQLFGFVLYITEYRAKRGGRILFIPKLHDRAQVFISCPSEENGARPTYVGTIERWLNNKLSLPGVKCHSNINLFILVENMGRVNYGAYMFDRKGILSSVYLDEEKVKGWKMFPIPLHNLNEMSTYNPITQASYSAFSEIISSRKKFIYKHENTSKEPAFYSGHFSIDKSNQVMDTFISLSNWGKGIVFVNDFNIGRYWPLRGPQCNLYVPAPILKQGDNFLVILELESPDPELVVHTVNEPDFTCGSSGKSLHQL
ncbi:beta-galactosidase 8 isoform X1 [Vigna unguiculata]|uniref:beta-galactosidase 8 isoform X1 n=1 Tax=Vigna unguiculata TaxID=3917 RepID=UPI0010163572|nr:beta-galactosidase 8 isoform X1 [Vigna unguiculata]